MIGTKFDSVTTALADKMLTRAENEINKYLSKRYDIGAFYTATASIPPLLTSLTDDLAAGYMHFHNSRGGKESMERGKSLIKDVQENLKLIADYKADLINVSGDSLSDKDGSGYKIQSTTQDYSNTFNEDDQINWAIDSGKLDDIDSERD